MDKVDLSGEFRAAEAKKYERYRYAKSMLEDDLKFIFGTLWNIVVALFLVPIFIVLYLFGED